MKNLIDKAFKIHELSNKEICEILSSDNFDYLTEKADLLRKNIFGSLVKITGLMQISNICSQNCLYCTNRKDNTKQRYTLSETDITSISKEVSKTGIKNIILQSGETSSVSAENIAEIIRRLKAFKINLIPALGERNEGEYRLFREAGAEQIILNLNTTSFTLFGELHPQMNLTGRVLALRFMKFSDIKAGSGILIGFPNQTNSSLADDILALQSLNLASVEIIPFIPRPNTPLGDEMPINIDKFLKVISITRLLLPNTDISISENINEIDSQGILKILQCGANVVIKNITDIDCNKKEIDMNNLKEQLISINRNL